MKRRIYIIIFSFIFLLFLILYLINSISFIDMFFYQIIIKLKSECFTYFMKFITFFAGTKFVVLIMFIMLGLYFIKKKKLYLIFNGIILGEVIINNILKLLIGRERPSLEHLVVETSSSFPSGHTMVSIVLYGFIIYLINKSNLAKKLKIFFVISLCILILLIMMSRIYLGVHYFSDVIAGMSISIAYLIFIIDMLERRNLL